jgi:hypothetical protein
MRSYIGKFCYSLDGEQYIGRYDTPESALYNGQIEADERYNEEGDEVTIYVAQVKEAIGIIDNDYRRERIGETIVDQLDEWLFDEICVDDRILELTREQQKELGGLVIRYMKDNASQNYYAAGDATEHKYIVGTSRICDEITAKVRAELTNYMESLKGGAA